MVRTAAAALLSVLMFASAAHAQSPSAGPNEPVPAPGIRASIAAARFDSSHKPAWGSTSPQRRNGTAQKVTAGVAGGFLGMLAGAVIGAHLQGNCSCDDPGLTGAIIGAPIGAIAGAIAGVMLASR